MRPKKWNAVKFFIFEFCSPTTKFMAWALNDSIQVKNPSFLLQFLEIELKYSGFYQSQKGLFKDDKNKVLNFFKIGLRILVALNHTLLPYSA